MTSSQTEERSSTPLHAKIEQMLTEARVVLPGAQALFGFQLAIVLSKAPSTWDLQIDGKRDGLSDTRRYA